MHSSGAVWHQGPRCPHDLHTQLTSGAHHHHLQAYTHRQVLGSDLCRQTCANGLCAGKPSCTEHTRMQGFGQTSFNKSGRVQAYGPRYESRAHAYGTLPRPADASCRFQVDQKGSGLHAPTSYPPSPPPPCTHLNRIPLLPHSSAWPWTCCQVNHTAILFIPNFLYCKNTVIGMIARLPPLWNMPVSLPLQFCTSHRPLNNPISLT